MLCSIYPAFLLELAICCCSSALCTSPRRAQAKSNCSQEAQLQAPEQSREGKAGARGDRVGCGRAACLHAVGCLREVAVFNPCVGHQRFVNHLRTPSPLPSRAARKIFGGCSSRNLAWLHDVAAPHMLGYRSSKAVKNKNQHCNATCLATWLARTQLEAVSAIPRAAKLTDAGTLRQFAHIR